MLIKSHRFHGYASLRRVYQRGPKVRGPRVCLKFGRRESGRPYRAAVVVSRKVSKSAVVRNRIRRRVYESIRQTEPAIPGGADLVFTVFSEKAAELESAKLQVMVTDLIKKTAGQP